MKCALGCGIQTCLDENAIVEVLFEQLRPFMSLFCLVPIFLILGTKALNMQMQFPSCIHGCSWILLFVVVHTSQAKISLNLV